MGSTAISRQPPVSAPVVAFDFDGTLTCRDSFGAFLFWRAGGVGFTSRLLTLIPALAAYGLHRDRGRLKATIARQLLGPVSRARLEEKAERFADERFDTLIRPDALRCWGDWKARGARLYIVTASPDILVAPFARRLGANGLIATRFAFDRNDRFAGSLVGSNCRGEEKVARLRAALGSDLKLAAAYGDTRGDREMLAMAERPGLRVFKDRPRGNSHREDKAR